MIDELKAKLFRGFADRSRLLVLEALRAEPRCVNDLVKLTGLSQSNLSMHLACLRQCGLVSSHRNGRFVLYRLADQTVARLLDVAEQVVKARARRIDLCPRYGAADNHHAPRSKRRS